MTHAERPAAARSTRRVALLLSLGLASFAVGGCESNSLFNSSAPEASVAPAPQITKKSLALAPVIGAPSKISKELENQVSAAVRQQNVPVAEKPGPGTDYTVRGYVVAAPEGSGTKLSYIWDVTDSAGKRAHRITGEEIVPNARSKDPWANITDDVITAIANKTAGQLVAWMPTTPVPTATAGPPVDAAPRKATPAARSTTAPIAQRQTAPPNATPQVRKVAARPTEPAQRVARKAPAAAVHAVVPAVSGAPGDGSTSLATALKKQLSMNGVGLAAKPGSKPYTVKGRVALGAPADGKQQIRIEWQVLDPAGKRVGTVSQKNMIPQGSLDGRWGRTADAAAAAAAQGIMKLIPKSGTAVN